MQKYLTIKSENNMNSVLVYNLTIVIIFLLISQSVTSKQDFCYIPAYLNISLIDTPDYRVNITTDAKGNIHTLTTVSRAIKQPIVNFMGVAKDVYHYRESTMYNITALTCQMRIVLNRIPLIRQTFADLTKKTNFTFTCPLKPGLYFMENVDFGPGHSVLAFLYRPNVQYVFTGGVYEECKNKSLVTLMHFDILVKIVRKLC